MDRIGIASGQRVLARDEAAAERKFGVSEAEGFGRPLADHELHAGGDRDLGSVQAVQRRHLRGRQIDRRRRLQRRTDALRRSFELEAARYQIDTLTPMPDKPPRVAAPDVPVIDLVRRRQARPGEDMISDSAKSASRHGQARLRSEPKT